MPSIEGSGTRGCTTPMLERELGCHSYANLDPLDLQPPTDVVNLSIYILLINAFST